ncbi:hypothetical protein OG604_20285 [Streptomyces sp. NBC_01231]|nr:hypothetical protein OG604_20285 [Streptomyces sp. NBC_01231]
MPTESAVELARASLALAFPQASDEELTRAAELVVRWGSEGVGQRLDPSHAERMHLDLMAALGENPDEVERRYYSEARPARTRFWTRPDRAPRLPVRDPDPDDPQRG